MKSKPWTALKKGDLVDIVAPGMKPKPGTLQGVQSFLESWGLRARIPKDLLGQDLICANDRRNRLKHLKKALLAKDSQMVWCARGGYGSFHLTPSLAKLKIPQPKCFVGLSDITSLHTFLVQHWGWSTVHGCNIDRFALGEDSPGEASRLKKLIFGQQKQQSYALKPLNSAAQKAHSIQGRLIGGNLITLQANFGTTLQVKTRGRILFFEDIGERAYRIDRVFEQMDQLKLFQGVRGVVFGQFTGGREPGLQKSLVPSLLRQFAESKAFPVFSGVPSGHGKNQYPVSLGTLAKLRGGAQPKIVIPSGVK